MSWSRRNGLGKSHELSRTKNRELNDEVHGTEAHTEALAAHRHHGCRRRVNRRAGSCRRASGRMSRLRPPPLGPRRARPGDALDPGQPAQTALKKSRPGLAGGDEDDNEPESVKRYRQFLAGAHRAPTARVPRRAPRASARRRVPPSHDVPRPFLSHARAGPAG